MPPFSEKVDTVITFSASDDDRPLRPVHPEVSDHVWTMIGRCWDKDPLQRMTVADVVDLLEAEMELNEPPV